MPRSVDSLRGPIFQHQPFQALQSSSLANGKDWNPKSCLPCRLPSPGLLVTTEDFRPSSYRNGLSYGAVVKNREDPLEKEMATHSSILAWEIPWTEKPGGLQPMGLQELDMTQQLNNKLCITLSTKNGQGVFQGSCLEGGCSVSLKHQISSVPKPPGGKPRAVCSCNFMCLRAQSCPTICDSVDQEPLSNWLRVGEKNHIFGHKIVPGIFTSV